MMSRTLYDTHHRVVINRGKFDACNSSSFRGVKADRKTHRQHCALYIRLNAITLVITLKWFEVRSETNHLIACIFMRKASTLLAIMVAHQHNNTANQYKLINFIVTINKLFETEAIEMII